jgi:hypothetical protein
MARWFAHQEQQSSSAEEFLSDDDIARTAHVDDGIASHGDHAQLSHIAEKYMATQDKSTNSFSPFPNKQ